MLCFAGTFSECSFEVAVFRALLHKVFASAIQSVHFFLYARSAEAIPRALLELVPWTFSLTFFDLVRRALSQGLFFCALFCKGVFGALSHRFYFLALFHGSFTLAFSCRVLFYYASRQWLFPGAFSQGYLPFTFLQAFFSRHFSAGAS